MNATITNLMAYAISPLKLLILVAGLFSCSFIMAQSITLLDTDGDGVDDIISACDCDDDLNFLDDVCGEFDGTVTFLHDVITVVSAAAGETWTITVTSGDVYLDDGVTTADGADLVDIGGGIYNLDVFHAPGSGYSVDVSNGMETLMTENECQDACTECLGSNTDDAAPIYAVATCADVDPNMYNIDVTNNGTVDANVTVAGESVTVGSGATETFGPFMHSGVGGAMQSVSLDDCACVIDVVEVLCEVAPGGGQASAAYCACNFNGLGNETPGVILAQAQPGTFEIDGKTQLYVLADADSIIIESNLTGLFVGLDNGDYNVFALNYCDADASLIEGYLVPGSSFGEFENGLTDPNHPLFNACYTFCPAEFEVDCDVPGPTDVTLMACAMTVDTMANKLGMFDLTNALAANVPNEQVMDPCVGVDDSFEMAQIELEEITFHTSYTDAQNGVGAIGNVANYIGTDSSVVYARLKVDSAALENACCAVIAEVLLTVKEVPYASPMNVTVCSGNGDSPVMADIDGMPQLVNGGDATDHVWTIANDGGTGITLADLTNADMQTVTVDATDLDPGTVTLQYVFTEEIITCNENASSECPSLPALVEVLILQEPVVSSVSDFTVCPEDSIPAIALFAAPADPNNQVFSWVVDDADGVIDLVDGMSTAPNHEIPTFNATTVQGTATIQVAVDYTIDGVTCSSDTVEFTVTVEDGEGPSFSNCPVFDIWKTNDTDSCGATVAWEDPTLLDNCGEPGQGAFTVTITMDPDPGCTILPYMAGQSQTCHFPVGDTVTVTYLADDGNGNTAECTFDVMILDEQAPDILCPMLADTFYTDADACSANIEGLIATATDNCELDSISNDSEVGMGGDDASGMYDLGSHTIVYTAVDLSGNMSTCSVTFVVLDTMSPTIVCPTEVVSFADADDCSFTMPGTGFDPVSYEDNCPDSVVMHDYFAAPQMTTLAGASFPVGVTTVTWAVTDASGNVTTCSFDVTVEDTVSPEIVCPTDTLTVSTDPSNCTAIVNWAPPIASDNCEIDTVMQTTGGESGTEFEVGLDTITYVVSDTSGNTAECSFIVEVIDSENPDIDCPSNNVVASTDEGTCQWVADDQVGVSDSAENCPFVIEFEVTGATTIARAEGSAVGETFELGESEVCYFLMTEDGEMADSCCFTVIVEDGEAPMITCPMVEDTFYTDADLCTVDIVEQLFATATDNCGVDTITNDSGVGVNGDDASGTYGVGMHTIIFTATDSAGNSASCEVSFEVLDTMAPSIVCPSDTAIVAADDDCAGILSWTHPAGMDNCEVDAVKVTYINPDSTIEGAFHVIDSNASRNFNIGVTTVSYVVVDASGNTSTCSFTVTVTDTVLPTIECPHDTLSVSADPSNCTAIVNWAPPVADDNCGVDTVMQTAGPVSGSEFPVGIDTITYVVSDTSGNTAECSFIVEVLDVQEPDIDCPSNNVVASTDPGTCQWVADNQVNVSDSNENCPFVIEFEVTGATTIARTEGNAVGETFELGESEVCYFIMNLDGDMVDSCCFLVIVEDMEAPMITCPEFELEGGLPEEAWINEIHYDDASGDEGEFVEIAGPAGLDLTGYEVILYNGNGGAMYATIALSGVIPDEGDGFGAIAFDQAGIQNGGPDGMALVNGAVIEFISYEGIFNATDGPASGMTSTDILVSEPSNNPAGFSIKNNGVGVAGVWEDPSAESKGLLNANQMIDSIESMEELTFYTNPDECVATIEGLDATATDNCSDSVTVTNDGNGDGMESGSGDYAPGEYTITWTAEDGSGNISTCDLSFIVLDTMAPSIECPADLEMFADANDCGGVVMWPHPVPEDNCEVETYKITYLNPDSTIDGAFHVIDSLGSRSFGVGTTVVTYIVTDNSGNTSSCSFEVSLTDTIAPTIECPADTITVGTDVDDCGAAVNWPLPITSDNCGVDTLIQTTGGEPGSTFEVGFDTITYVVSDTAGNTAECSFILEVIDTQDPDIDCPSNIVEVGTDEGVCTWVGDFQVAVVDSAENCPFDIEYEITGATEVARTAGSAEGVVFNVDTSEVCYFIMSDTAMIDSCCFLVIVVDEEDPVITCPSDTVIYANDSMCGEFFEYEILAEDNCTVFTGDSGMVQFDFTGAVQEWTVPAGVTEVFIEAWGAEGGIGGSNLNPGALGGFASGMLSVTPGETLEIYVGGEGTTDNSADLNTPGGFNGGGNGGFDGSGQIQNGGGGGGATDVRQGGSALTNRVLVAGGGGGGAGGFFFISPDGNDGVGGGTVGGTGLGTAGNGQNGAFGGIGGDQAAGGAEGALGRGATAGQLGIGGQGSTDQNAWGSGGGGGGYYGGGGASGVADHGAGYGAQGGGGSSYIDGVSGGITMPGIQMGDGLVILMFSTEGMVVQTEGLPSGALFPVGETVNTWVAMDEAGNEASCSFTVTVLDTVAPVIDCPTDTMLVGLVDGEIECGFQYDLELPLASDNCVVEEYFVTYVNPDGSEEGPFDLQILVESTEDTVITRNYEVGVTEVILYAEDPSGNVSTCSFEVTVVDSVMPFFQNCPDTLFFGNDPDQCSAFANWSAPVAFDNCDTPLDNVVQTAGPTSGSNLLVDTLYSVTYVATDDDGNTAECTFIIDIIDTECPEFVTTMPLNETVDCHNVPDTFELIPAWHTTDNCTESDSITFEFVQDTIDYICAGTFTLKRTWTIFDEYGNNCFHIQKIYVIDTMGPIFTTPADTTVSCEVATDTSVTGQPTDITDLVGCSPDSLITVEWFDSTTQCGNQALCCNYMYTIWREWVLTDDCGNESRDTQIIDVVDMTAPDAQCQDITVYLDENGNASISANDINGGAFDTSLEVSSIIEQLPAVLKASTNFCPTIPEAEEICDCPPGFVAVGYSGLINNEYGAGVVGQFNIYCKELLPDGSLGAMVVETCDNGINTSNNATFVEDITTGNDVLVGAMMRRGCGIDRIMGYSKPLSEIVLGDANMNSSQMPGIGGNGGSPEMLQFVPDGHVIVGMETFEDDNPPLPEPGTSAGVAWRYASIDEVISQSGGSTDNCAPLSALTLSISKSAFDCDDIGVDTVVLSVEDPCGNVGICVATVTILDTLIPTLVCPGDETITLDPGACEIIKYYEPKVLEDNCDIDSISIEPNGVPFPIGETEITIWVIDEGGNTAECSFSLTVLEYPDPITELACNDAINISLNADCEATITPDMILEGGPYACYECYVVTLFEEEGGDPIPTSPMVTIDHIGVQLIAEIQDTCNGGNICWGYVNVENKLTPDVICPPDMIMPCNAMADPDITGVPEPTSCPGPGAFTIEYDDEIIDNDKCGIEDDPEGESRVEIIRTWTITDFYGNSTECVQLIQIVPFRLEQVVGPENYDDFDNPSFTCAEVEEDSTLVHPDNTGYPLLSALDTVITVDTNFVLVLDDSNNVVVDTVVTIDTAFMADLVGLIELVPNEMPFCDFTFNYWDKILEGCGGSYEILRTWIISSICEPLSDDNPIEIKQRILVWDNEDPVIAGPDTIVLSTVPDQCYAVWPVAPPQVIGECSGFDWNVSADNGDLIVLGPNDYLLNNIPVGETEVIYVVTDDCYNQSYRTLTIIVNDDQSPTAVCDEFTVVGLNIDGTAEVFAESFDDGSHDNCNEVYFKVIRQEELCGSLNGFKGGFNDCLTCDGINADLVNNDDDPFTPGQQVYFDDVVRFCCDDAGVDSIMIVMRVFEVDPGEGPVDPSRMEPGGDLYDSYNDCQIFAHVEDELPPVVICVPDITVGCEFEFDEEAISDPSDATFGKIVEDPNDREPIVINGHGNPNFTDDHVWGLDGLAADQCEYTVDIQVSVNRECGQGVVTRVITVTDQGGKEAECVQRIFFEEFNPFNEDNIDWPDNVELSDVCLEDVMADPEIAGEPEYEGDVCANILMSIENDTFVQDGNACVKILRTWKILDWCQFDENTGEGLWSHIQVIKLTNEIAPEFTGEEELYVCDSAATGCEGFIELVIEVEDDCSEEVEVTYSIDANDDGDFDIVNVSGTDASGSYPFGTHRIVWTAVDGCDNVSTFEQIFTVADCKKPSPKCFSGIVTVLMESGGTVDIWASEFDAGSEDNCGDVVLSFSEDTSETSITYTCDDLGTQTVQIWVTDEAGNQDFCETFLFIQDNNEVCDSMNGLITGVIHTVDFETVNGVQVNLDVAPGIDYLTMTTENDGKYVFDPVTFHVDYELSGYKNDDPTNGVSTYDIVKIQKHLLALEEFDSPYKYIAADVNNSQTVTAADMVQIRKLILGEFSEFPDNTSWRFVVEEFEFEDPQSPWPFDEMVEFAEFDEEESIDNNFYAVKIGDLTGNAEVNELLGVEDRTLDGSLNFIIDDEAIQTGEEVKIDFRASDFNSVLGYQFTFKWDASVLDFERVEGGILEISESNFGMQKVSEGLMSTSWSEGEGMTVENDEILFSIVMTSKANDIMLSEVLTVSDEITAIEAYADRKTDLGVSLLWRVEDQTAVASWSLLQNSPNPFDKETVIGFEVAERSEVGFKVYDGTGKVAIQINDTYEAGYHQLTVKRSELGASGVWYYEISAEAETSNNTFTKTRKMILLD